MVSPMTEGKRAVGLGPVYRLAARVSALAVALAAFLCFGAVGTAAAATLHVAESGNDSGDCVLAACETIQYAVGQAGPGDTVSVAAGEYDEEVTISTPGLTIQGAAAGGTVIGPPGEGIAARSEVVLDGTADGTILRDISIRSRAQNQAAILAAADEPIDGVTLDGVNVRGIGPSTTPTTVAAGLEVAAPADGWSIFDSSFEDNYTGILVNGDMENLAIEGSRFEDNRNGLYVARTLPLGPTATGESRTCWSPTATSSTTSIAASTSRPSATPWWKASR
jgi:nitrous oxidase accessory protein NosD